MPKPDFEIYGGEGLQMPAPGIHIYGFEHVLELYDKETGELLSVERKFNRIPQLGLDFLIKAPFGKTPAISSWYCGLFAANFTATASTVASDIPTNMNEFTSYAESARPAWTNAYDNSGTLSNAASKAVFTPNANATVYGSFIVSSSEKGGSGGLLLSVAKFDTAQNLTSGVEAKLSCGLTYVPSA